ncbi:MAG: hypothetical protein IPJ34_22930 [Myxococcales bacterium]|nr:hypothetical protein [Myxococcales bacterium]
MKRALLTLVLLAFAGGCTPTPEAVCKKLEELGEKEKGSFKLSTSKCLKSMNELKERDPDAYKCAAKTIVKLSNLDTAFLALSVCDKNKPKKSKSADDDDDKGKKKSSDDDDDSPKKKKSSDDD